MNLTSYERMRRYAASINDNKINDNTSFRRGILSQIPVVSSDIEGYINRKCETGQYTEYYDVTYNQRLYQVQNYPISTIDEISLDIEGQFDGYEQVLSSSDYTYDEYRSGIVLLCSQWWTGFRSIKIKYVGGLASSAINSVYTLSSVSGTITPGLYCIGDSSLSCGIVRSTSATVPSVNVEVLYGVYTVGEGLNFYSSEDGSGTYLASSILQSKTSIALCESHPSIVNAAEVEVYYRYRHKGNFENVSTQKDGTSVRTQGEACLRPETKNLLKKYRRIAMGK